VRIENLHLRSLEGLRFGWVTNSVLSGPLLELLNEFVIDTLLDVDSGTSAAALAVVEEDTEVHPGNGIVDVGVVEDNVGRFTAEFESDFFEVGGGGCLEDLSADEGGAGEGDFVDVHVGGDSRAGNFAEAGDDVDDTWRNAGLFGEFGGVEAGERGLFSTARIRVALGMDCNCAYVLRTTTLPQAMAGPIFHDHIRSGKFHGMI
jgi:hypothetical protein